MAKSGKTNPPARGPGSGRHPGYAEPQPRDKGDARRPDPRKPPNPDEGGLRRDPETDADPTRRDT